MTVVYVCSTGEYSTDWDIDAIFTKKTRALEFQRFRNPGNSVMKWELDCETLPDWYDPRMPLWGACAYDPPHYLTITARPHGTQWYTGSELLQLNKVRPINLPYARRHGILPDISVTVSARDEPHAIKIASELFIRWKAEQAGIA